MAKSFEELVDQSVAFRKSRGAFNYSQLADQVELYWEEQLGPLYEHFYKNVQLDVSIGLGWLGLYRTAAAQIQNLLNSDPTFRVTVVQVKEKFGGLRLYTHIWSEGVEGDEFGDKLRDPRHDTLVQLVGEIIGDAEAEADRTCELCGKPGVQVAPRGWVHVACPEHTDL